MAAYRIACNRSKAADQYRMPPVDNSETGEEAKTLLTLQCHVLERIFVRLHLTDLARCCQVCKGLQSLVQQDSLWQLLCSTAFPTFTALELKQWVNPTVQSNGRQRASHETPLTVPSSSISGSVKPSTYRSARLCLPGSL